MTSDGLNIGVIGAGRIGRLHAEHLAYRIPAARVLMIADVIEEAARQCAARYGIPHAASDYRAVIEHPDIQAVAICSATDTHAQIIERPPRPASTSSVRSRS